jgi:hypothetical protein
VNVLFRQAGTFPNDRPLIFIQEAGNPPFAPQLQPRYDHLLGRILFNQREYARAGEYFQKVLKDTAPCNARVRASALLRLGMMHDVRMERKRAEEYYTGRWRSRAGKGSPGGRQTVSQAPLSRSIEKSGLLIRLRVRDSGRVAPLAEEPIALWKRV